MPTSQVDWLTLIATYICTFLSLTFIVIRLICRRMRGERYWSFHDDMWMGVSVIPLLLRLGLIHVVIMNGTNSISREVAQNLDQVSIEKRIVGSKLVLASRIAYPAFLWCMKACILAFLSRLMSAEPKYARAIRAVGVGLVVTFLGLVLGTLLECRPFDLYFQMPGPQCTKAFGQLMTMGALNIATDVALIILPLPLIFKSQLPLFRKVQLCFLFTVSFAVIVVTVVRMPLIVSSTAMQNSRTLWASIEILTSCIVANAPILNNFYFEWKNKRRRGTRKATQMPDDDADDDELRSRYSMQDKAPKIHLKRSKGNDSMCSRTGKGHARDLSEESLTRTDAGRDAGFVIEATTSVTQSVSHAAPETVRKQQSRYYKGDFLGTQVWADQVFPGPKDPSQHVNYGMNFSHQNNNNGAHAHHHTGTHSHSKRPSHNFTDIPTLGVLPSAPPRALLNAITNRKTTHGCADHSPGAAGILRPFARRGSKASESEEELGPVRGASRTSLISGMEEGAVTPGIEMDQQHKQPML